MKSNNDAFARRRDALCFVACLVALVCAMTACSSDASAPGETDIPSSKTESAVTTDAPETEVEPPDSQTESETLTDSQTEAVSESLTETEFATETESALDTQSDGESVTETESETTTETETEPTVQAVIYPAAALPDYAQYTSEGRIAEVLSRGTTYAFTPGGTHYYQNGRLSEGGADAVVKGTDDTLILKGSVIEEIMGKSGLSDGTPEAMAAEIGMNATVYDHKLVLFFSGDAPLQTYADLYTFEAMYLRMIGADETELKNAFIDLPARISNNISNTVFYTDPNLNLGVQTAVYFAQMGQMADVPLGPALVAGEGEHDSNFTTVRIFNEQQTVITQFSAFGAGVTGGVQVAAARVGGETQIATAAYAAHDGARGDIRVFDAFGLLRMTISLRNEFSGPYTIVTGHLVSDVSDEVLLIAARSTDAEGKLPYVILSLSDGSILARHDWESDLPAHTAVSLSVRHTEEGSDPLVAYVRETQSVYEGSAATGEMPRVAITLPSDAIGVSPSNTAGERYTISLPAREESEDQSFLGVADADNTVRETDVGFRENRFYSALYTSGFNDDRYVSRGDFCHVRTDLYSHAILRIPSGNGDVVGNYFADLSYGDFACWDIQGYANRLPQDYLFLEPCFSHRWLKTDYTNNLAAATDPITGERVYVSMGRDGQYHEYSEVGVNYHIGTYADGILDLAKLRLYPLRSFLQGTAPAFRGENGTPEHLVGVSPVHEHEIYVPGSSGDYNAAMIEGFRLHMLARYGSAENINARFGTAFASDTEIDPPRGLGRGDWDHYGGAYYAEWCLYNRSLVSKRIMEAYREALLAGYPPEAISTHQMPEGTAAPGFLGDLTERLTPTDIALSCGTAYGGTRYGTVFHDSYNLVRMANRLGHNSISLGEYCARTYEAGTAYTQIKDFWGRGVRMVHHIPLGDAGFEAAEAAAIRRLEEENKPRPGYTGGTYGTLDVGKGDNAFRIVQIGEGADSKSIGLLKSIDAEGNWEGTVYLVPFHTKQETKDIPAMRTPMDGQPNRFSTGVLPTVKNADQVEVTLLASTSAPGATLTFATYHEGTLLEKSVVTYTLTDTATPYRYVLSNQLYESGLEIVLTVTAADGSTDMSTVTMEDLTATLQTEKSDYLFYSSTKALRNCAPHVGGVSFDVLTRDQ